MNFGAPAFLWLFAALAPLLAAYLLKVRPRRHPVNAFFLWEQIFQEKKASSLFQKLRDVLSLLLLALALGAAVLAAAGMRPAGEDRRDLLVVIDTSPSMMAGSGGDRAIQAAREKARELVRALNGTRRAALATAGDELTFLSHASDAPKDLTEAIARVTAGDVPIGRAAIEALNACARGAGEQGRVLLITDGQPGWEGLDPAVEILRVGGERVNAGIVAADLDRKPGSTTEGRFFYRIASTVKQPTDAELELRHESIGLARLVPVVLRPGEEISDTLDVDDAPAGRWTAELRFDDDFATDNTVALGLAEPQPVEVRVDDAQPYFFQRCLQAFGATGGQIAPAEGEAEVTITRGAPADAPRQVIFAPAGESPFWTGGGEEMNDLAAESKLPEHPVARHLDFEALRFEGARDLETAAGSVVLAVSETGRPLLWKSRVEGRDAVVVNLDPALGEFFFSPAFPALVHSAAVDLAGRGPELHAAVPTGTQLEAGGPVTLPDGATAEDGRVEVAALGHYLARMPRGARWFGGALFEHDETLLDGSGPADSASQVPQGHPLAFWLLALALALLAGEFILYHRRKAG